MQLKTVCTALALAACSLAVSAAKVTVYDTAAFLANGSGGFTLDGFGRGSSNTVLSFAQRSQAVGDVAFFDTWNLDVSSMAPGTYSFGPMFVDAAGGLTFTSVTFNSYDASGARNTVLFDLNAPGTQAVGAGTFTVLASCPVASCVWIDVTGLAPAGHGGYGGTTVAALVPEPASVALLALGLAVVGGVVRQRAKTAG